MFSKVIYVFAMLCVVNASVITVNVFDDDPETEGPTRAGCTFLACDHYCRGRYGYVGAGGRCINGHCKCDYFRNTNDEVSETVSNLEDTTTPGNCNLQACNQQCHQLKFPGGACVNNHCKCDNSLRTEEYPSARNCDYQACNHRCQKFGYKGGVCVNGRCKCNQDGVSVTPAPATLSESSESQSQQDCNFRACDQLCRRLGFTSGVCVNGRCKCDNFLYSEDVLSVLPETILQRGCNFRACARHCRNLGFPGGACVDGRCKCDNFSYTQETTPVNDIPRVEDEDSNLIMKADEDGVFVTPTPATLSESSESQSQQDCNFRACDQLCRRLGFTSGVCVNGRCKCDNFLYAEDVLSVLPETILQRSCNFRACARHCRNLGFPGGACVYGRCKCDNFSYTQETTPVNDIPRVEDEDSNLMLKADEDELILPASRACNTVNCNDLCHRLNYAGGMCKSGVCQCY